VLVEMARHHWGLASRYSARELGFAPRDPLDTLRDTIAWLRAHHPDLAAAPGSSRVCAPGREERS
jgi:hypothetical protein